MIPDLPWGALGALASAAGKLMADGWIGAMLTLWGASLWLLRWVLAFMDALLHPDLSPEGPGRHLYQITWAIAGALAVTLSIVQVGLALFRRDGRSAGRLLVGVGQFWLILAGGLAYAQAVLTASSALTRALMESLLGVATWREWQPWQPFDLQDITDAVLATALGLMATFVLFSAVALFLIMVTRSAVLLVLVATSPIAAAGLVSEVGHSWFWKACRWFHALALTPPLVVLVLGVGLQFATGAAAGLSAGVEASIGTAFGSVLLMATASFSPLALFKLLAFVDPGTASGAAARAGYAAAGGLAGLIRGNGGQGTGSDAASRATASGSAQGEGEAESATGGRVGTALAGFGTPANGGGRPGPAGGPPSSTTGTQPGWAGGQPAQQGGHPRPAGAPAGPSAGGSGGRPPSLVDQVRGFAADGIEAHADVAGHAAAMGADVVNQTGSGHNGYYPDYSSRSRPPVQHGQIAHTSQQQASTPPPSPPTVPPLPGSPSSSEGTPA